MIHGKNVWFILSMWHSLHMWHEIDMQWCITLHMHGNIAFHGCECMVESKHLIWWLIRAQYRWTKSNRVARLYDMEKLVSVNSKKG